MEEQEVMGLGFLRSIVNSICMKERVKVLNVNFLFSLLFKYHPESNFFQYYINTVPVTIKLT